MSVLPILSIYAMIISISKIDLEIYADNSDNDRLINCGIKITNKSFYSFLKASLTVRVDNSYYGYSNTVKDVISISSGTNLQNLTFEVSRCGKLCITTEDITYYDLFGLINARVPVKQSAVIDIMPKLLDDLEAVYTGLLLGMSDNEDDSRKGNEYSDTSNIREYIPGDRIKDIHWKLSAKRDNLLVRDRIKSCENRLVILLENSENPDCNDDILALYYSIVTCCIKEGILAKTYIFDSTIGDFKELVAGSMSELVRLMSDIYSIKVSEESSSLFITGNYIRIGYINGQVNFEIHEG